MLKSLRWRRRVLVLSGAAALAASVGAIVVGQPASAAAATMTATANYNNAVTVPSENRFLNNPVTDASGGQYTIQTNLWNKAVSGGYTVNYNTTSTAWSLTNNTANSYFAGAPGTGTPGIDSEPSIPNADGTSSTYTCTANSDAKDTGCNWAGHGDPWVNPKTGTRDGLAINGMAAPTFLPQQPGPNDLVNSNNTEFSNQIHAPASYADIFLGCHWGVCTPGTTPANTQGGAPFPLQYTGISRLDSVWNINVPAAGVYDASYDIWLDTNTRNCPVEFTTCSPPASGTMPLLPTQPKLLNNPGQNDGAEIMIWVGHHGYSVTPAGASPVTTLIQPTGVQLNIDGANHVQPVTIPNISNPDGTPAQFDVWAGRARSFDNGIRWNVISFVNRNPVTTGGLKSLNPAPSNGGFDSKPFLDYASTIGNRCSTDPTSPVAGDTVTCMSPTWWMTSVQAGYEIWNMPQANTMGTTAFAVNPVAVSGGVNTGNRSCPAGGCAPDAPAGTPLINWLDTFNIVAQGCPNATDATWQMSATNFATNPATPNFLYPATLPANGVAGLGRLAESPPGSGNYISSPSAGPLNNANFILHDVATITMKMTCNGVVKTTTATVFIDPSGEVLDLSGTPVVGASVTLFRSTTQTGTFTAVANGDTTVMSPANTHNPSVTDAAGRFRWDVTTGWYKVSATKSGCTAVGTGQSDAEHVLPPPAEPITAIKLLLDCGTGGLPTSVVVRAPGITPFGYCADITVTNNTNAPVNWNTHFPVPGNYHINQAWNMVYTQVANQATNVHADPANPWNTVLAPGQSTNSVGFCAVP